MPHNSSHEYSLGVAVRYPSSRDQGLIQIVDAALDDAKSRSGEWLACCKGCTSCCIGVFAINQLDAARLRRGLGELARLDPARAGAVQQRAREAVARLCADFPGDLASGLLGTTKKELKCFEGFGDEEPCPALNPVDGTCDLYAFRPMTCRTFGPPVRVEGGGLGVCELCYQGRSQEEIAGCEMVPDPDDLESRLVREVEARSGKSGDTIVAFVLAA